MVTRFQLRRGDVCWYDFGAPVGSESAKRRPALVVQSDDYNDSNLDTTIVVPLTSRLDRAQFPDNVFIPAVASSLDKDSVALTFQVAVVNRTRLDYPIGRLPTSVLFQVDDALCSVLGIAR
jgi:mRNA interferase MazF